MVVREAWRKDVTTCEMNGDGIEIVEMDAYQYFVACAMPKRKKLVVLVVKQEMM